MRWQGKPTGAWKPWFAFLPMRWHGDRIIWLERIWVRWAGDYSAWCPWEEMPNALASPPLSPPTSEGSRDYGEGSR